MLCHPMRGAISNDKRQLPCSRVHLPIWPFYAAARQTGSRHCGACGFTHTAISHLCIAAPTHLRAPNQTNRAPTCSRASVRLTGRRNKASRLLRRWILRSVTQCCSLNQVSDLESDFKRATLPTIASKTDQKERERERAILLLSVADDQKPPLLWSSQAS